MDIKPYVSPDGLKRFLNNLWLHFAPIKHNHTLDELSNLNEMERPDWNESDPSSLSYIQNRPFYEDAGMILWEGAVNEDAPVYFENPQIFNETCIYRIVVGDVVCNHVYAVWDNNIQDYIMRTSAFDEKLNATFDVVVTSDHIECYATWHDRIVDGVEPVIKLVETRRSLIPLVEEIPFETTGNNMVASLRLNHVPSLHSGQYYKVQVSSWVDAYTYMAVGTTDERYVLLGDHETPMDNPTTRTPVTICFDRLTNFAKVKTQTATKGTLSIYRITSEVQPIDPKYLPDLAGKTGNGYNSVILNDYTNNNAEGLYSVAEGQQTEATGVAAHAEGTQTVSEGHGSHAEGDNTVAEGDASHAEGVETYAAGLAAHAEGFSTSADGDYGAHAEGYDTSAEGYYGSHAEGRGTVAASESQHVQGRYNIIDEDDKYAHIVGNGKDYDDELRSNAHTIDWDGNAWFAGGIQVGGGGQDGLGGTEVVQIVNHWHESPINFTLNIDGTAILPTDLIPVLEQRKTYIVKWNSVEYRCVCWQDSRGTNHINFTIDDDAAVDISDNGHLATTGLTGSHSVHIAEAKVQLNPELIAWDKITNKPFYKDGDVVKKIDEIFIPDTFIKTSEISNYMPEVGVDYFTEEDKQAMVEDIVEGTAQWFVEDDGEGNLIINTLTRWEGGSY